MITQVEVEFCLVYPKMVLSEWYNWSGTGITEVAWYSRHQSFEVRKPRLSIMRADLPQRLSEDRRLVNLINGQMVRV